MIKRRVLLVDDDAFNVVTLEKYFERLEIPTNTAFNGAQAIQIIEENIEEYRMILMDCNMPIIDGLKVNFPIYY